MECRFCGRPTTLLIDGMPICEECYENAGSCCLEFGGQDLWQRREEPNRALDRHSTTPSDKKEAGDDQAEKSLREART